jgi:hypothetical protein
MRKILMGSILGLVLATGGTVLAEAYLGEVSQGVGGKKGPWIFGGVDTATGLFHTVSVDDTGALKTAGGSTAISFMAGVPTVATLSASTSACVCSLTAGADYEFSCSVAAAWRHGAATPTALLTDNDLAAGMVRSPMRMPTSSTCLCFISSSAGSCKVSLIPTT